MILLDLKHVLMAGKIMIKKHKNRPKSSKIWKFQNNLVYGGYVPAPYTGYKKWEQKYNKTHPEKESKGSLFCVSWNDYEPNKNNTWEVVKNIKYDIICLMKTIN